MLKYPEPEKITLIGHSLGGRIVLDLASVLAENGKKVDRLILLGTAGQMDEKDVANCRKVSVKPVINIFCPDDNMLKLYLYKENMPLWDIPELWKNFPISSSTGCRLMKPI